MTGTLTNIAEICHKNQGDKQLLLLTQTRAEFVDEVGK